jgi:hypothetical protein
MKTLLIVLFSASSIFAQYAPSASGSTTAAAEINGKPNWQTSTSACVGLNGTVGKDWCTDTVTGWVYTPSVTGTPATWMRVNSTAAITGNAATATALATLPTPCSTGQAPTGILANGNSTGCAAIGGGSSVCKATFAVSGGTATMSSHTGCITAVTYNSLGNFTLTLVSPPANWVITCAAGFTGITFGVCESGDGTPQQSSTSTLITTYNSAGFSDPHWVEVVIQ